MIRSGYSRPSREVCDMPTGGGDPKNKGQKKKSKKQLEKEMKKGPAAPPPPMTFEVVKPKRKTQDW